MNKKTLFSDSKLSPEKMPLVIDTDFFFMGPKETLDPLIQLIKNSPNPCFISGDAESVKKFKDLTNK